MTLLTQLEKAAGMLAVSASMAGNLDANIYAGRNNGEIELPCVVCVAESAEEVIRDSGIFRCNLVIQVQEKAIDTDVTSSLAQSVYDAFATGDVHGKLRTYSTSSLMVHKIDIKDLRNAINTDDKSWIQESNLDVICALQ